MTNALTKKELNHFATQLKAATLSGDFIRVGSFLLAAQRTDTGHLVNFTGKDLLDFNHQYLVNIRNKDFIFHVQLYENTTSAGNKQFRLASYVENGPGNGMIFTINLSRNKSEANQLSLTSKLTFTQQPKGHKDLAKAHRRLKQYLFAEVLSNLSIDVTDENDVIFGIYDLKSGNLLNTTFDRLLNDFLVVSILKGHFMANKGYEIELFPSFKTISPYYSSFENENGSSHTIPSTIKELRSKRTIPLSLRYKVLHRDGGKCVKCGSTPHDGVKLHVDHIHPHSLGGLTAFNNLRTLCNECNIGRSNKYLD